MITLSISLAIFHSSSKNSYFGDSGHVRSWKIIEIFKCKRLKKVVRVKFEDNNISYEMKQEINF